MKFCILVSACCLLTSVGLSLDVGVDTILVPSGTIDSGQSVIPRMVISNMTNEVANNVSTYFMIDDGQPSPYSDSIVGLNMPALATETLAFGGWIPRGRDSMTVIAWVHSLGDTYPQNDTFRQRFLVRVKDIAITQILMPPPDTILDPGQFFFPQCRAWNFGDVTTTFDVRFTIGEYRSTARGVILPPGYMMVVTAPDPCTTGMGIWACAVLAMLAGDMHPENNIVVDTFTVRGTITVDVDARAVLAPTGVVDTTMAITPSGRFGNLGTADATFWAFFSIRNSGGAEIYAESSQAILSPGESADIEYPPTRFSILGYHIAVCSTAMLGDQNSTNDVKYMAFRVVPLVTGDIGVVAILSPPGQVPPDSSFVPTAVWKNYSRDPMEFGAFFFIHDKYGVRMYSQLADTLAGGGEEVTFSFTPFNVGNDTGTWCASCSTATGDTNFLNDTLSKWFRVVYPGVEEAMNNERVTMKGGPTVLRRLPAGAVAFDAMGRRSAALKSGIYFVREEPQASSHKPQAMRKVILGR
jgi:hypothetical protein